MIPGTKPKTECIGEVFRSENGALVFRPRPGAPAWAPPQFFQAKPQCDGSWLLAPIEDEVTVRQAAEILGMSERTLHRVLDMQLAINGKMVPLLAWRFTSPGRLVITRQSVVALRQRSLDDPHFWGNCRAVERAMQRVEMAGV